MKDLHQYLGVRQRVDDSEQCLTMFIHNNSVFVRSYVRIDESWSHHYTPERKRLSAQWTGPGESSGEKLLDSTICREVMASLF